MLISHWVVKPLFSGLDTVFSIVSLPWRAAWYFGSEWATLTSFVPSWSGPLKVIWRFDMEGGKRGSVDVFLPQESIWFTELYWTADFRKCHSFLDYSYSKKFGFFYFLCSFLLWIHWLTWNHEVWGDFFNLLRLTSIRNFSLSPSFSWVLYWVNKKRMPV